MPVINFFDVHVENLNNKVHNMGADSLKFILTNTAPVAANSLKSDITEIAGGNGYTAGGHAVAVTSSSQTAGVYSLVPTADIIITASGGSIGPFRYAVLLNDTPTSPLDPLIGWYDKGTSITVLDGDTFTFDVQATLYTMS